MPGRPPLIVLAGLGLAVGLTAACQRPLVIEPQPICNFNPVAAMPAAEPAPAAVPVAPSPVTEMPLNSVNITDVAITNKIMIQSANARRNPAGTVEVWTRLVNCTDYPLQIEARTHFLDEGRAPIEKASAWNRVFLPPRTYGVYNESSTDVQKVRYYYVEVREGR